MKKYISVAIILFGLGFANAQGVKFGVKAGIDFATIKISGSGYSAPASETQFYAGTFADITASEKIHIQPELVFVFNKEVRQLQLPLLAKIFVAEKLGILVGPDVFIDLNKKIDGQKSAGVGLDFGGAYEIDKNLSIEAKYNLGITNLIKNIPSGINKKINGLFLGMDYKF